MKRDTVEILAGLIVPVAAIIGVVIIEVEALRRGINGTAIAASIGGICGIAGYKIKGMLNKRKGVK